jgi:hypothetical protein
MTPARVAFLVVGTPRSGTTLVQRLAGELPGVAIPYETHFFPRGLDALAGHGDFPLAGAALRAGLEEYAASPYLEGAALDVDAVLARLDGRAASPLAAFDAVVATAAGDAAVLGEKTPGHLHWAAALAAARPDLRVVGVVREPRAVVASHRNVPWGGVRVEIVARRWLDDQQTLAALRDTLGPRLLVVRYEDVVTDPGAAQAALAGFLDRRPEPVGAAPGATAPARLPWETWKDAADQPISAARVDAWTETLTRVEGDRVAMICRSQLDGFGYGSSRPGPGRGAWALATSARGTRTRARALAERREAQRARIAATALT